MPSGPGSTMAAPLARKPAASMLQQPQAPCTAKASSTSSTRRTFETTCSGERRSHAEVPSHAGVLRLLSMVGAPWAWLALRSPYGRLQPAAPHARRHSR
eukprot:scaffold7695_cov64-Phaeocystis_antarctica.AAC.11